MSGARPAVAAGRRAIGLRSVAHLRAEPTHKAELVSQILMGHEAVVLDGHDKWLRVRTADRYEGWVHRDSVVCRAPGDPRAFADRLAADRPPAGTWIVTATRAIARDSQASDAAPATSLVQGARVTVVELQSDTARIAFPDGATGWLPTASITPFERLAERFPPTGASILDHGARFLGLPYLWGGKSELGFDCSGFVQSIFGLHGVRLPRDASEQAETGVPVDVGTAWSAVEDGDLLFLAEPPGERVSHVGILARGGRLLHASTTRHGVAWNALDDTDPAHDDYARDLVSWTTGVRRVLPRR